MRTAPYNTLFEREALKRTALATNESVVHDTPDPVRPGAGELVFEFQSVRDAPGVMRRQVAELLRVRALDSFQTLGELADALEVL